MTRNRLSRITKAVAGIYAGAILLGVLLRLAFPAPTGLIYQTYRDLIPLIIALPAAFLAQAFQRRSSYVQGLRAVWSNLVNAVAAALTFTQLPSPSQEQYADVLRRLSAAIEEVRGFYANVPAATPSSGWYPFEPVKQIYEVIRELGFGDAATSEQRDEAQELIYAMWKRARERFLAELEVEIPTHHHAAYAPDIRTRTGSSGSEKLSKMS
jgi:hypothetical protein